MTQYDRQYQALIKEIITDGEEVKHERMGHSLLSLAGKTFEITDGFPILTLRKIPVKLFVAEQIWFLTGSNKPDFIQQFTGIWDEFVEKDGTVAAAYGYRWRRHFGRDQILRLVEYLKKDPSSTQGVALTWDPGNDSLGSPNPIKNNPCPIGFTINIIGNRLNLHLIIRSNDMMLGNPHDVAGFALLQRFFAGKLGREVGKLTVSISHAHVFDHQLEGARELVRRRHDHPELELTLGPDHFDRALAGDRELVEEIVEMIASQYEPLARIKLPKVVVGEER